MRAGIALLVVATVVEGCSLPPPEQRSKESSDSSPDPAERVRPVVIPDPPVTCTHGGLVEQLIATDDGAIACLGTGENRDCWSIRPGVVIALPRAGWPAPRLPDFRASHPIEEIVAPAGWTATARVADWGIDRVEICGPPGCQQVPLARTGDDRDDSIATIAIAPDGKRVAIDRGLDLMSESRVELYSLEPVKRLRTVAIPGAPCTNVVGWFGPALVAQGSDCSNAGGSRALFDRDGKRLAAVRVSSGDWSFDFIDPVLELPGERAVFFDSYALATYDLRTGKRLAQAPHPLLEGEGDMADTSAVVTRAGTVVLVDYDGPVAMVDASLEVIARPSIPRCPIP